MEENKNKRNTRQRAEVLEEVTGRCDHPTADEVYLGVRGKDSTISRGTVYRNLNMLAEEGKINKIKLPAADRFDLRTDNHYHIACERCGKVIDAPVEYREEDYSEINKMTGFTVFRHEIVFDGICPDCLKKLNKEN